MATLSDVAVRAGVSLATASRVLNGSAHRVVGPELRQRVTAAAAELGYVPNKAAQAMARGHTDVVSLVVGSIADPYFSSIVAGVSRETQSHDLRVTISESDGSEKSTLAVIANASSQQARALIFAGGAITSTPAVTRAISDFTTHTGSPRTGDRSDQSSPPPRSRASGLTTGPPSPHCTCHQCGSHHRAHHTPTHPHHGHALPLESTFRQVHGTAQA